MTEQQDPMTPATDLETGTYVLVLGAGCSVDCEAPTMQQFMRRAREYQREKNEFLRNDYEAVSSFRQECLRLSYILLRYWENIEELFTQAHLRQLLGDGGELVSHFELVIWDVYRRARLMDAVGYDHLATFLMHRLNKYNEGGSPRPVVITTNYDVHLETALLRNKKAPAPVYPGPLSRGCDEPFVGVGDAFLSFLAPKQSRNVEPFRESRRSIEVLKLHGSVNWFRGEKESCSCEHRLVPTRDPSSDSNQWRREAHFYCQTDDFLKEGIVRSGLRPLIVPPLLGKTTIDPVIAEQWKRAVRAFRYARGIVFAGYSFPETDAFMTRLLGEGLRRNDSLEEIFIINVERTDAWLKRIRSIFSPTWRTNNLTAFGVTFAEACNHFATEQVSFEDIPKHLQKYIWPREE